MDDDSPHERRSRPAEIDGADGTDDGSWTEASAMLRRQLLQSAGAGSLVAGISGAARGDRAAGGDQPARGDRTGAGDRYGAETPPGDDEERRVRAVATDGETALVGTAPPTGRPATRPPFAYVLSRSASGWDRAARFEPPDGTLGFGTGVAVAGDRALVGAPRGTTDGHRSGTVAAFARHDGEWRRTALLRPPTPTGVDRFGAAVALEGDTALVGASTDTDADGRRVGAVVAFERDAGGWRRTAVLRPADPTGVDRFGRAVALTDGRAVVGCRAATGPELTGAASLFEHAASGWSRRRQVTPPRDDRRDRAGGSRDDRFGTSVAVAGGRVAVGAPTETNGGGQRAGAVHVFGGRGSERVTAPDAASDDRFGAAVATDGRRLLVGADRPGRDAGAVHLFERGAGWRHVRSHTAGGRAVAASDGLLAADRAADGAGVFVP